MPRRARAIFVAFHAGHEASRVIASELRAGGFVELVPCLMWRPLRGSTGVRLNAAMAAVRRRMKAEAFVIVRFVGEHPRLFAKWTYRRRALNKEARSCE